MIVTHRLKIELLKREIIPQIDLVQNDKYSRNLELELCTNGVAYQLPAGSQALVRYRKPDGTGGSYDTLPNGDSAWHAAGNLLTVALAPQVCTCPGTVSVFVTIISGMSELSTFRLQLNVEALPREICNSEEYVNITGFLPQPQRAKPGQFFRAKEVDAFGKILTMEAVDGTGEISTVNAKSPDSSGNVRLTAADVDAVPLSGGTLQGDLKLNGHFVRGLPLPTEGGDAVPKRYLVDRIAAQGTSGIWTWRKWESGLAEIWGTQHFDGPVPVTTQYGAVYGCAGEYSSQVVAFPFPLIGGQEGINEQCTVVADNAQSWACKHKLGNHQNSCNGYLTLATKEYSGGKQLNYFYYVTGRWK